MSQKLDFSRLSQRQIAEAFGVTDRTVRDWEAQDFPRNRDGTYSLRDCIGWKVTKQIEQIVGDEYQGQALSLDGERARLAKEQADKVGLENTVRRGEVADLHSIAEVWANLLTAFRARLLAAPSKLAPRVNPENPNLARDLIAAELEIILEELATHQPDPGPPERPGPAGGSAVDPSAAAATGDQRLGGQVPEAKSRKQRRARPVAN